MYRKFLFLVGAMTLVMTTIVWAEDGVKTDTLPEGSPQITTVTPQDTEAIIDRCRYPRFEYSPENDHPACERLLRKDVSLTPIPVVIDNVVYSQSCPSAWQAVNGLTQSVIVPPEYRKTASLMVTWTIRVEGLSPVIHIGPPDHIYDGTTEICGYWHGTSIQSFPGGKVQTRLMVNGTQMPVDFTASLTLPDGGGSQTVQSPTCGNGILDPGEDCDLTSPSKLCPPYADGTPGPACNMMSCSCKSVTPPIVDPTITGSVVLKPTDFSEGKFPDGAMQLGVQWNNDTCMTIRSQKNFRSMIVTVLPQGNQ